MVKVLSRRNLLACLVAAPVVCALDGKSVAALTEPARPGLATDRYFGAAVRMDQIESNPVLRRTLLADCASLTPEVHMKWDALQPEPGRWRTGPADDLVDFAARNGLLVRGHTLLWDQSTPAWAKDRMLRTRASQVIDQYIDAVVGRYSAVVEWDVVNEPIDTEAGHPKGFRANTFLKAYGEGYVANALRRTRAAAPNARLMINDYSFDYDNPVEARRRTALLRLLEQLRRDDVPLDGIGLQAHLDLSKGPLRPEIIGPFLREIADLGLFISITELDVKEDDQSLPLAERDQRVADEVRRYLDIAFDVSAVRGVTTWGLSDVHSWLQPEGASGDRLNRGLPYDAQLNPKPMHEAIRQSLTA